jgi:porin
MQTYLKDNIYLIISTTGIKKVLLLLLVVVLLTFWSTNGMADINTKSGYEHDSGFSGPSSVEALLEEADKVKKPVFRFPAFDKTFEPWFNRKRKLKENYGIELGISYSSLYQIADNTPDHGDDKASGGIFRFMLRWNLIQKDSGDTGNLTISFDHRHAYTDSAPGDFGFAGNYGISGTLFNDGRFMLGDLNWKQTFGSRKTGLIIGRYDPNDYFDVLGYANPWTSFQNIHILLNTSIALPDRSTGIGIGHYINKQWYIHAAANDVNGVGTEADFNFDLDELYTTAEISWSPSKDQRYFQNVHLTVWHADEKEDGGSEESKGMTIGANWTWNETWMLFAKLGWSEGSAPFYNESYTVGMIRYLTTRSDKLGLAINWGEPPDDNGLNDQWTLEFFYRLQFSQNLAITPSLQYIIDPALNPNEDSLTIFGLRLRLTL